MINKVILVSIGYLYPPLKLIGKVYLGTIYAFPDNGRLIIKISFSGY